METLVKRGDLVNTFLTGLPVPQRLDALVLGMDKDDPVVVTWFENDFIIGTGPGTDTEIVWRTLPWMVRVSLTRPVADDETVGFMSGNNSVFRVRVRPVPNFADMGYPSPVVYVTEEWERRTPGGHEVWLDVKHDWIAYDLNEAYQMGERLKTAFARAATIASQA